MTPWEIVAVVWVIVMVVCVVIAYRAWVTLVRILW